MQCLGIYLFQAEFCKGHKPLFCKCLEEQTKPTDPSNADRQLLEGMGPRCSNERLITFAPKASILTVLYHKLLPSLEDRCLWGLKISESLATGEPPTIWNSGRGERLGVYSRFCFCVCPPLHFIQLPLPVGRQNNSLPSCPRLASKINRRCEMLRLHTRPRGPSPLTPRAPCSCPRPRPGWRHPPSLFPPAFFKSITWTVIESCPHFRPPSNFFPVHSPPFLRT